MAHSLFVTGTGTDVGKTTVSKWLCYHLGYDYFKPIQTGLSLGLDQSFVQDFTGRKAIDSRFIYAAPLCPQQAAFLEDKVCDITHLDLPQNENLLVEGAGGVYVPINHELTMCDLLKKFQLPALIVAHSGLGTINHSLLTIAALKQKDIPILGLILNGPLNPLNKESIEKFSGVCVLDELEYLKDDDLKLRKPSSKLQESLNIYART
jgi:dethiobiotin synthetase